MRLFHVETLFLQTLYVLIFVEIGSRRVHFAGYTAYSDDAWVTQQTRHVMWDLGDREPVVRFLIPDNDKKFTRAFNTVFHSEGIDVIPTPIRAPNANTYMERWIRSVREECLDKLLIVNQAHLRRVLPEFAAYYNTARPHQGIDQKIPIVRSYAVGKGQVRCRNVLGGIIHDYYREAA